MLWAGLTYSGHPPLLRRCVANLNLYEEEHIFAHVERPRAYLGSRFEAMKAEVFAASATCATLASLAPGTRERQIHRASLWPPFNGQ